MLYSIINASKGENAGFSAVTHLTLRNGSLMVVNENELRKLCDNISDAAASLDGRVLTHSELINIIKQYKHNE